MFERSEVDGRGRPPSFWLKIVVVVAIALIVINAFRVNPPDAIARRQTPFVADTKGPIVQEPITVEVDDNNAYRMSFPYASTLKGSFRVREKGNRVLVLVLDEENRNKYLKGDEYSTLVSTGRNPSGKISRKLDAGTYFLVFDNRGGTAPQIVDAGFVVE